MIPPLRVKGYFGGPSPILRGVYQIGRKNQQESVGWGHAFLILLKLFFYHACSFSLKVEHLYTFVTPRSNLNLFMVIKAYVMFPIPGKFTQNPGDFAMPN